MNALAETILQFGSGRFLRAFADLFIHHGNAQGQNIGRIVIVQSTSTGEGRTSGLNAQHGRYHVVVRGYADGEIVDHVELCESVSRALTASCQWAEILELARSPHLHTIISNTTEAGYADDGEDPTASPPQSFPGKLWAVLHARWLAGLPGVTIIPCELIEGNAAILKQKLVDLAVLRDAGFIGFLEDECVWLHTLVDRIVTGTPAEHPLLAVDPMLIVAEPFAFWALEGHPRSQFKLVHPAIVRTADVKPYFLRKVRLLNAAHTALLMRAVPRGFQIVRDAVNDPELGVWLWKLLSEDIVPTLEGRVDQPLRFAEQTLERFRNPFLDHKFSDIALHHAAKVQVRLVPTAAEYTERFGHAPKWLGPLLADSAATTS